MIEPATLLAVLSVRSKRICTLRSSFERTSAPSGRLRESHIYADINISLTRDHVSLDSNGEGPAIELWFELKDLFQKRHSYRKQLSKSWSWYIVFICALNIELWGFMFGPLNNHDNFKFHIFVLMTILSWPISYFYSLNLPTLRLSGKGEGSFWKRNRESIILVIIGSIFGGIVTYLVTILAKL